MKLVSEVQNNYLKYQLCGVAGIFYFGSGKTKSEKWYGSGKELDQDKKSSSTDNYTLK